MTLQEHIVYIDRMQKETRDYCTEQRKRSGQPLDGLLWPLIASIALGATLFAAGAIFMKVLP